MAKRGVKPVFEFFKRKSEPKYVEYVSKDGEVLRRMVLDEHGAETPDPTPMAPPLGYKKQPSMVELVREMVKSEHVRQAALAADAETFEEADDFEVNDPDGMPESPHENEFDPPVKELVREGEKAKKDREEGELLAKRKEELEKEAEEERAYRRKVRERDKG